jgi:coniferyl-aldehyde dehydrogenase
MGLHHGLEGFREFSNERAVMEFKNAPAFIALVPPYGEPTKQVLGMVFGESEG